MISKQEKIISLKNKISHSNEVRANRIVLGVILFLDIIYAISAIFNRSGIFEPDHPQNYRTYILLCLILTGGIFLSFIFKKKYYPLVKITLLTDLVITNTLTGCFFFTFTHLIFTIPILVSIGYYKYKVSIYTSAMVWIGYFISMLYALDTYTTIKPISSVILQFIIEESWVVVLYAAIAIAMTFFEKKFAENQIRKNLLISAMESEISLTSKIQQSVLPPQQYISANQLFEINASIFPAKEVAGDFYDYFSLDNDNLAIVIADVSDKGLPAAMFMMQAKETIRNRLQGNHSISEAVKNANNYLTKNNNGGMFVTAWIGIINTKTGIGKYINAGHLPPIIKHANGTIELLENDPNLFMGSFEDTEYDSHLFKLKKGDALILYTDGVTDALNSKNEPFGTENLKKVIQKSKSAESIFKDISNAVIGFSKKDLFDDITILSLRSNAEYEALTLDIETEAKEENTSKIIDEVNDFLAKVNCPEDTRKSVDIILDEICTNIADYAYENESGKMNISCKATENSIEMTFVDFGKEFNPLNEKAPEEGDILNIGGFGIHFVKNLSDEVSYERIGGKNKLTAKIVWNI